MTVKIAKHEYPFCPTFPYVPPVAGIYPADQRIPEGLRRVQVLLPLEMVVELDIGIARSQTYVSRSKVIALAVRKFLDAGELENLPPDQAWPK